MISSSASPSVIRKAGFWAWCGIIMAWLGFLLLVYLITVTHPLGAGDFVAYYKAAYAISQGTTPYIALEASMPYLYPPLLAQLLSPIVAIFGDFRSVSLVWLCFNVAVLLLGLGMLVHQLQSEARKPIRWLWWVPLLFTPTLQSFWSGQVTILLFTLVVGAWAAFRSGRPVLTGVLLAVAGWIKIYPGFLIVYFLWKREYRVVLGVIAASALLMVFQVAVSGIDVFASYFREVLPSLAAEGQHGVIYANQSILGFAQKLFMPAAHAIPLVESPLMVSVVRWGLVIGLLGSFLIASGTPGSRTSKPLFDLEYALASIFALLLGSTLAVHGMLSLLLPIAILVVRMPLLLRRRMMLYLVLIVMCINLNMFLALGYLQPPSENRLPALLLSTPFLGTLLLLALIAIAHGHLMRQSKTAYPEPAAQVSATGATL